MKTSIKRSELYAKVWQAPMTKLAKEFDISDVGLAKVCKKHDIPTPRAGHWAKLAHGKAAQQTPLPEEEDVVIRLQPSAHRLPQVNFKPATVADAGLIAKVIPALPIEELELKLAAHCRNTLAALKKVRPDSSGFLRTRGAKAFTCVISEGTRGRAIPLLDAIEKTINNLGGRWKVDEKSGAVALEFNGELMQFNLTEQYKRTESQAADPNRSWYTPRTFSYQFKGELTLTLEADYRGRKTWSDGKRGLLEGKLSEFAAGVQNAALAIKEVREEQEARNKRWEEEAKLRQEAETKARHFSQFRANLLAEADAWHDFHRVKEYVAHLEGQLANAGPNPHHATALAWMEMAKACTESLNPTVSRIARLQSAPSSDVYGSYYGTFGEPITKPKA